MKQLQDLVFNNAYHALGNDFYSAHIPEGLTDPYMISTSRDAAALIDLDPAALHSADFLTLCSGNGYLPDFQPLAMVYSGHQFGGYSPRLGDGRALLMGQVETAEGGLWDLHLKGAGMTEYSRHGDGYAVLRSSIREYLCSEAMAGLGIPTTRALALVGGKDTVVRDGIEPRAMVMRLAESHVRFGSFEYFYHTRQHDQLPRLADYVITHHYPQWIDAEDRHIRLFQQVVTGTAELIAQWQAVGFAHGVMNTDNMSILGQTLDYGPFGFMDDYDPNYICNHSDHTGRYAFNQQPTIGLWNCNALAHGFSTLVAVDDLRSALERYETTYLARYHQLMCAKLGLQVPEQSDDGLYKQLLALMAQGRVDYTRTFRALSHHVLGQPNEALDALFDDKRAFTDWLSRYEQRIQAQTWTTEARHQAMQAVNPKYVLRNYLAQEAIQQAESAHSYEEIERLLTLLRQPFAEQPEYEAYAAASPDWGKALSISCSS